MKFHVYKDAVGEWRWSLVASNGRIVGDSGEGYKRRVACLKAIASIKKRAADAKIVAGT